MYIAHYAFTPPENEDAKIWRYMDFTKFVSLLDKGALFFARADRLGDPFEGSYTKATLISSEIREKASDFRWFIEALVKNTTINSWHLNENESAAMWKLYLVSNEGIAIQSTFNRLKNSILGEQEVRIGKVRYIDYENDVISDENLFNPFLYKRKSFEHELELRAIVSIFPNKTATILDIIKPTIENGIYIPVDLETLIETIWLAPTCPTWLKELVTSVTKKYGLNKDIFPSKLNAKPIF